MIMKCLRSVTVEPRKLKIRPPTPKVSCACSRLKSPCRCTVFFFSSRRRHTRFDCDWSSDVCFPISEGTRVAASLNNRVIYLADIGMIAPLLGLLGTVFGIIHSFGALGADIGSARYVALSRGISEALVNTAAGLAIGIPAMIFYAFFRGRAQKLISELEAASTHVLDLLSLQYGRPQRTPVLIEEEL